MCEKNGPPLCEPVRQQLVDGGAIFIVDLLAVLVRHFDLDRLQLHNRHTISGGIPVLKVHSRNNILLLLDRVVYANFDANLIGFD